VNDEMIGRYLRKFCTRAKITKKITSHCFRHSYCSHLLAAGCGLRQIAALVGHHNLDVTAGYARVTGGDLVALVKTCHPRERENAGRKGTTHAA
jgi:integrase/recombinase XerD